MKILVTGGGGFVGSPLLKRLNQNDEILTLSHVTSAEGIVECDIRNREAITKVFSEFQPNQIYHLAALVQAKSTDEFIATNVGGTRNLLEAIIRYSPKARVLLMGSSAEYGATSDPGVKVNEETVRNPVSKYGESKVEVYKMFREFCKKGFDGVYAVPFNIIGSGLSEAFLSSRIAKQVMSIKLGNQAKQLELRNTFTSRDYTDISDVVDALVLIMNKGVSGEVYNICSEKDISTEDLLNYAKEILQLEFEVVTTDSEKDLSNQDRQIGSSEKLRTKLGWSPQVDLKTSLNGMFKYWEERL